MLSELSKVLRYIRLLRYIDIVDKYRKLKNIDIRYSNFRVPKVSKITENIKISKEYRRFYWIFSGEIKKYQNRITRIYATAHTRIPTAV